MRTLVPSPLCRMTCRPLTVVSGLIALAASVGAQTAPQPDASSAAEDVILLPEFSVKTSKDTGYMATESTSGTRVATQILNLPYSVQVLTEDFVNDFKLFDLDEQVPFIGGMAPGDKNQGGGGGTRLRGFFVPYFRNGFYRRQAPDSSSIARVEVVKGPQSAIYGRVAPGGVINYISKKPLTRPESGFSYTAGSYDYQRLDGYTTGPLIDQKLFYRVDASYYDFQRATDFWYNRTLNLSGSFTYTLSPSTSVSLEFEHTDRMMNDVQSFLRWLDANGIQQASTFDLPSRDVARRLTQYNTNGAYRRTKRGNDSEYLVIEHRFAPDLSLHANLGYSARDFSRHTPTTITAWDTRISRYAGTFALVNWADETQGMWTFDRTMQHQTIDDLQYGAQIDLTKTWKTSSATRQRTLLTFDAFEDDTKQKTWTLSGTALNSELAALGLTTPAQQADWKRPDPFSPSVSGYLPIPDFKPSLWPMQDSSTFNIFRTYYGGLLNHTVELFNGRLAVTASARQDWAEYNRQQPLSTDPQLTEARGQAHRLTYSGGVNYHLIPRRLVAYISYGTSFDPAPQADPNTGQILGNRTSKGVDVGLKGVLLHDTLSYTLSAYRMDQQNEVTDNPAWVAETDPAKKDTLARYIGGAGTHGDGLSLDVSGSLTKRLTLIGNIAWSYIEISKHAAAPSLVGTKPLGGQNVPARSAALALRYDFGGALQGFRVGASYQYSTRFLRFAATATATDFYLPEVNQVGAFVAYGFKAKHGGPRVDLSVNVTNLFNEDEITIAAYAPPGREVRMGASVKF